MITQERLTAHSRWLENPSNEGRLVAVEEDLSGANLRAANLRAANLSGASFRGANLRDANFSGAKGYPCPSEWVVAQEVDPAGRGIVVYKQFGLRYRAPADWRIEPGAVLTEAVNSDRGTECGSGINVAPRSWRGFNNAKPIWKLLIEWRDLCTLVVPFDTDGGKVRVGRATILGEVE